MDRHEGAQNARRRHGGCLANYLAEHARTLSTATLARRLTAIGRAHILAGFPNPTHDDLIRITLRGIRRTCGRPQQRAAALTAEHLIAIVSSLGNSIRDVRDRALLLVGFAGAFRRSELVALDYESIEHCPSGLIVTIRKSKTDQERHGRKISIPISRSTICPVRAFEDWIDLVKQRSHSISRTGDRYSSHSLRAGFVTTAALAGVPNLEDQGSDGSRIQCIAPNA
jgi:site-specific recombinase XerC